MFFISDQTLGKVSGQTTNFKFTICYLLTKQLKMVSHKNFSRLRLLIHTIQPKEKKAITVSINMKIFSNEF
jgi:hypothetical protein